MTSGNYNDAYGRDALGAAFGFGSCCAFGNSALKVNNGDDNSAFGFLALGSNTTGVENTAVGPSIRCQYNWNRKHCCGRKNA